MDADKIENLEAAGFAVGNAADFLELIPEEGERIEF